MEEAGVRPPGIVLGAFGGVPGAEGTQSPVRSIPSTPAWELRAGQDHPTPVFLHDACFAPGAESARRRPPCAPAAPGTRRGPAPLRPRDPVAPRTHAGSRLPFPPRARADSARDSASARARPVTGTLQGSSRPRERPRPIRSKVRPHSPPHPPTPPRSRPGRARSARRILGDAPRPQEWTLKM